MYHDYCEANTYCRAVFAEKNKCLFSVSTRLSSSFTVSTAPTPNQCLTLALNSQDSYAFNL